MNKPVLSKQAFWGVDMDKIDYEKNALDLIERVMYRATLEGFQELKKSHGTKRFCNEVIHTKRFGPKEVNFCCNVFELKPTDFIYFMTGQSKTPPEYMDINEFDYYN